MGLHATVKGIDKDYNGGYIGFMIFRIQLAKSIDPEFGDYYWNDGFICLSSQ